MFFGDGGGSSSSSSTAGCLWRSLDVTLLEVDLAVADLAVCVQAMRGPVTQRGLDFTCRVVVWAKLAMLTYAFLRGIVSIVLLQLPALHAQVSGVDGRRSVDHRRDSPNMLAICYWICYALRVRLPLLLRSSCVPLS
jgi:hypothetical protein